MKHLLSNDKDYTYIHTIYGKLFKMKEPIENAIEFVEKNKWLEQTVEDIDWSKILVNIRDVDIIFNSKIIWYNNYNEEFFNQFK